MVAAAEGTPQHGGRYYPPPETAWGWWKMETQRAHRPRILARDRDRCAACGARDRLELAHVTPAASFGERFGWTRESLARSYRDDNLAMLCKPCHDAYDKPDWWSLHPPLVRAYRERARLRREGRLTPRDEIVLARRIDALRREDPTPARRARVRAAMAQVVRARGWRHAEEVPRVERREARARAPSVHHGQRDDAGWAAAARPAWAMTGDAWRRGLTGGRP